MLIINKIDNGWLVKWTTYESCTYPGRDHQLFCSTIVQVQEQVGKILWSKQ